MKPVQPQTAAEMGAEPWGDYPLVLWEAWRLMEKGGLG